MDTSNFLLAPSYNSGCTVTFIIDFILLGIMSFIAIFIIIYYCKKANKKILRIPILRILFIILIIISLFYTIQYEQICLGDNDVIKKINFKLLPQNLLPIYPNLIAK